MKRYSLNRENINQLVDRLVAYMKAGAVIVIPTETCYGLAIDMTNKEAVDRLYKIKQRPLTELLPVAVSSMKQLKQYAIVDRKQENWLAKNLPATVSVIFQAKNELPLKYQDVVIRFSTNSLVNMLAQELEGFALTSANIHGFPETYSVPEVESQFAARVFQPDLYVDAGQLPQVEPSTIIDLRERKPKVLRQGLFQLK